MQTSLSLTCILLIARATAMLAAARSESASYEGFSDLETIFSFGDSYTKTGWDYEGTLPSSSNPFGNTGSTSSNGQNWIQYLTTKHNSSLLLTYNFAIGGATVDNDIVSGSTDVKTQVQDRFIPMFSNSSSGLWKPESTLFSFWVGINDVEKSYLTKNSTETFPEIFSKYADLLDQLYGIGAQNFLFLNVPALERSPRVTQSSAAAERIPLMKAAVSLYNSQLQDLLSTIKKKYSDATFFHLDTYKYFDQVQSKAKSFIETSGYRNTSTYCSAYTRGTDTPDYKDDSCDWAADEYLWLNSLHPTSPIHELISYKISKQLQK